MHRYAEWCWGQRAGANGREGAETGMRSECIGYARSAGSLMNIWRAERSRDTAKCVSTKFRAAKQSSLDREILPRPDSKASLHALELIWIEARTPFSTCILRYSEVNKRSVKKAHRFWSSSITNERFDTTIGTKNFELEMRFRRWIVVTRLIVSLRKKTLIVV